MYCAVCQLLRNCLVAWVHVHCRAMLIIVGLRSVSWRSRYAAAGCDTALVSPSLVHRLSPTCGGGKLCIRASAGPARLRTAFKVNVRAWVRLSIVGKATAAPSAARDFQRLMFASSTDSTSSLQESYNHTNNGQCACSHPHFTAALSCGPYQFLFH